MAIAIPGMGLSGSLLPFVIVAVAMVVITIAVLGMVLTGDRLRPLVTQMLLALTVIVGGSLLLLALLGAMLTPGSVSAWTWVLVAFNGMMAVPPGLWFIGQIVLRDRRVGAGGWGWPLAFGVATTGSEVLMGVLFAVGGLDGPRAFASALAQGLSSVWFYGSMVAVMGALLVWAPLSRVERIGLLALVGGAAAGPWIVVYPAVGGVAVAAVMGAAWAGLAGPMRRGSIASSEARLWLALAAAFAGMAVGGLALAVDRGGLGAELAFGSWMALVMAGEVAFLVRRTSDPLARPTGTRALDASVPLPSAAGAGAGPRS
jgi:hypothetical protein